MIIFPIHPRTRKRIREFGLSFSAYENFIFLAPLGYLEFLGLQKKAKVVITDSGGVQEETTYLKIPCITLRKNTERPITIKVGSNSLVGDNIRTVFTRVEGISQGRSHKTSIPKLWDGLAAKRIARLIKQ